ncbi:MAG: DUF1501 domain-containing protein, partial [Actinomycetes bacterium]
PVTGMLRRRSDTGSCSCESGDGGSPGFSRRAFLKRFAATGALAGLSTQGMATRLAFADGPYAGDVLVVLSLRGGFDGLNAIVPTADPAYSTWRPTVGIPQSVLLPLDATFGMHPAMSALKPYWDAGTFGVVQAVGQPDPTRSHFEAMEAMERAAPGTSARTGWIDRTLGLRAAGTAFQGMQLGSGMAASSFTGPTPELAIWSVDSFELSGAWDATERQRWQQALRTVHDGSPTAIGGPAGTTLDALAKAAELQAAGYTPANGATYPDTDLGKALRDVARLVKADVGLQVACVDYGDWDMHVDMGSADQGWLFDHLTELSGSLDAFATDLGNRFGDVTVVTLTEFGRRVEENGSAGVDHGHGQAVLLLGGGVDGGKVHGSWPGLAEANLVDGDLAGTTDYRTILAEALEKRCGAGSLSTVFPNLPADRVGAFKTRV